MDLPEALARHAPSDPEEEADLAHIRRFVAGHRDPFSRAIPEGHLTASAFVVAADGRRMLLVRHRKLQRWLQPGGHAEAGETRGEEVALREAGEETGLARLALHPLAPRPLDVDVHLIPARPGEPAHEHLDLRYLVIAGTTEIDRHVVETEDARWFTWDELPGLDLDPGLRRGLAKARRYLP